jgi:hypothetical protein
LVSTNLEFFVPDPLHNQPKIKSYSGQSCSYY